MPLKRNPPSEMTLSAEEMPEGSVVTGPPKLAIYTSMKGATLGVTLVIVTSPNWPNVFTDFCTRCF